MSYATTKNPPLPTVRRLAHVRAVGFGRWRQIPAKSNLRLVKPATEKRAVAPRQRSKLERLSREYLRGSGVVCVARGPMFRSNVPSGSPLWIPIEPCALRRNPLFCGYWRKSGNCTAPPSLGPVDKVLTRIELFALPDLVNSLVFSITERTASGGAPGALARESHTIPVNLSQMLAGLYAFAQFGPTLRWDCGRQSGRVTV